MKWICESCKYENSSCKIYCKCGLIDSKYKHLATPPEKKNCFWASIVDNELHEYVGYGFIGIGILTLLIALHIWGFSAGGYWSFVPCAVDGTLLTWFFFFFISTGC